MDLHEELKSTIDQIGRRFEEFKTENDKNVKKAVADALAEAKLAALGQAIDDLTGKKEDLEKRIKLERDEREALERKVNQLRLGAGKTDEVEQKALGDFNLQVKALARARGSSAADVDVEAFRAYKQAFQNVLRKGEKSLPADEFKVLQVGVDSDGGFLVPADTSGRIVSRVFELSPIRAIANVQPISSDRLEGIADIGEAADGWVGETTDRPETATPGLGKYEIMAHEQYAQPKATQKLLDDASVDVEAWLATKVADRFARREGAAFITGNGAAQPRGFAAYPTAATADATRAWGTLEHVNTGVNSAFAASNPADVLFDLEASFKTAYLANARIVTRRSVITLIRKFKDLQGQYLWQPGLQAGRPATLIGYPLVMAEDMPALAAGSLSLAMGDFSEGYQIVDRLGVRTLRDPYTEKPYVKFYSIRRVGGAVVNFEAIKFLRFGT
jgi:HK97 family phage major capsid protein